MRLESNIICATPERHNLWDFHPCSISSASDVTVIPLILGTHVLVCFKLVASREGEDDIWVEEVI